MARVSDPSFPAFTEAEAEEFRDVITSTMIMGEPNQVKDKATFYWEDQKTFSAKTDGTGVPFDLGAKPTKVVSRDPQQIPIAWSLTERAPVGTPLGQVDSPKMKLTILDRDYAKVEGADYFRLGGNRYDIDFVAPPQALYQVDVYTIYATAFDES